MRISDWSSDVCSSYLRTQSKRRLSFRDGAIASGRSPLSRAGHEFGQETLEQFGPGSSRRDFDRLHFEQEAQRQPFRIAPGQPLLQLQQDTQETARSEEHTSELQSLMRISYAVFCLKKKTNN